MCAAEVLVASDFDIFEDHRNTDFSILVEHATFSLYDNLSYPPMKLGARWWSDDRRSLGLMCKSATSLADLTSDNVASASNA